MRYIIKQNLSLLEALAAFYPDCSNNTLRTFLKDERVLVDGKLVTDPKSKVTPGQQLEVLSRPLKKEGVLTLIYEDTHLVVINKPEALLSVATHYDTQNTAHAILKKRFRPKKVYVIHRLDKETSGVMMFALSEEAYNQLKSDLARHIVKRTYYGIVEGNLQGKGTWVSYLYEDKNYLVHSYDKPHEGTERAVTHYEAIKHSADCTLVRFELETGKKNQIRVQCTKAGHPIYGDEKYGAKLEFAKRLYLHAFELQFMHPITKKALSFSAPLPKEFLPKFP